MQLLASVFTSFRYPHNFPSAPQPVPPSDFFGLDAGTFLCPRWQHMKRDSFAPVIVAESLLEAAALMHVIWRQRCDIAAVNVFAELDFRLESFSERRQGHMQAPPLHLLSQTCFRFNFLQVDMHNGSIMMQQGERCIIFTPSSKTQIMFSEANPAAFLHFITLQVSLTVLNAVQNCDTSAASSV